MPPDPPKPPSDARVPRVRYLLPSRIAEQASLGLGMLLLAARLGPDAVASILLLGQFNAIAVIISDFSLGWAVLRHPRDRLLSAAPLRNVRLVNAGLAAACVGADVLIGGVTGTVITFSGLMWAASAEAFIRKSAALRLGDDRRVAIAEVAGSAVFFAGVCLALVMTSVPLVITGVAFVAKHVIEILLVRRWRSVFSADGDPAGIAPLLGTRVANLLSQNIDYAVVLLVFADSPATVAIYFLAFRIATVAPAQVDRVMRRVSLVGLSSDDDDERQAVFDRYVSRLFLLGLVGGAGTVALAPALAVVLDPADWAGLGWVIVTLAIAIPFRLVFGVATSAALTGGATRNLLVWDICRVAAYGVVFGLAASFGFGALVGAVSVATILAATVYLGLVARTSGVRPVTWVAPASVVAAVIALGSATVVQAPIEFVRDLVRVLSL